MKDSYTFDLDPAGLDVSFDRHKAAYLRIFDRLGIPVIPVEASSGAMGGSDSTEFMCPSDAGEDLIAHCPAGNYDANVEKATSALAAITDGPGLPAPERFDTPGVRTIDALAAGYDAPAVRQMVSTGEQSGTCGKVMTEMADYYEAQVTLRLKSLTAAVEPIILLVMGSVVGFIALSLFMPLFRMARAVS